MSTRPILWIVGRLLLGAVCALASASCGSEMLRTGRSPVYVVITRLEAAQGNSPNTFVNNALSDVDVDGTVFNDLGRATFVVTAKDPSIPTTAINAITLTRYQVAYRRTDGRNAPGVDVPYALDGGLSVTISAGATSTQAVFDLVRHAAKLEPPLRNLRGGGGHLVLSTVAEITFYGRDQNGNEVTVSGLMDLTFGDF